MHCLYFTTKFYFVFVSARLWKELNRFYALSAILVNTHHNTKINKMRKHERKTDVFKQLCHFLYINKPKIHTKKKRNWRKKCYQLLNAMQLSYLNLCWGNFDFMMQIFTSSIAPTKNLSTYMHFYRLISALYMHLKKQNLQLKQSNKKSKLNYTSKLSANFLHHVFLNYSVVAGWSTPTKDELYVFEDFVIWVELKQGMFACIFQR